MALVDELLDLFGRLLGDIERPRLAIERLLTRADLPQHGAKCKDVAGSAALCPQQLLRRSPEE